MRKKLSKKTKAVKKAFDPMPKPKPMTDEERTAFMAAKTALVVLSGGMDSATLAYHVKSLGVGNIECISFDYGQRHRKELESAAKIAAHLGAKHTIVDISGLRPLLKGSALTDETPVPHGHYAEESMKQTVVPNRNAIMTSIAWGYACTIGAQFVCIGVHAGDHHIYADCRPEFCGALNYALRLGTVGNGGEVMSLYTPFINKTKTHIAAVGKELGVPFADTWTCYEGAEKHCGQCGACQERKEAFKDSNQVDPTEYAHNE